MTLKSHGVTAACKAASSGFDSHRRLGTINCRFGLHLYNVKHPNHFFVVRVIGSASTVCRDSINMLSTRAARHDISARLRSGFSSKQQAIDPTAGWNYP